MTPERAKQLIESTVFGELPFAFVPNGSLWNDSYPVKEHGITEQEWNYIVGIWKTMLGKTCFNDALYRVARGEIR